MQQIVVGESGLRVLVDHGRIGVRGQVVGVKPVILDVLAVVALLVGHPVGPFLEDAVVPIPQGHAEADGLLVIAPTRQTVVAPPVGPAARMVERKVCPGIAIGAVVLSDRTPGTLTQIRSPTPPGRGLVEAVLLGRAHWWAGSQG
ncbi:hypothetical protein GCM10010533_46380 [Mycolicibacterium pallens]